MWIRRRNQVANLIKWRDGVLAAVEVEVAMTQRRLSSPDRAESPYWSETPCEDCGSHEGKSSGDYF